MERSYYQDVRFPVFMCYLRSNRNIGKLLAPINEIRKIETKFCLRVRSAYASIRQMDVLSVKTKQLRPAIY